MVKIKFSGKYNLYLIQSIQHLIQSTELKFDIYFYDRLPMNVYWFKRDLRIEDNEALFNSCRNPEDLLLLYILEPILLNDEHYAERHFNFIKESIYDLNTFLCKYNARILCVEGDAADVFKHLHNNYNLNKVFSTEETGIDITYTRDKKLARFFRSEKIIWQQYQNNGVLRGITNRDEWRKKWYSYMASDIVKPELGKANLVNASVLDALENKLKTFKLSVPAHSFQKGGRFEAIKYKSTFFASRIKYYSDYISKPKKSRKGCSRLSPYFAWGNLSIREVYQEALELKKTTKLKKQINAFVSRLRWQGHFIQKFEQEPRMEFEAVNKGYLSMPQPKNETYIHAWKEGLTGYPLVDANIIALKETGYTNFRMRSMLTSFLCHHLFQHFTHGSKWLARQFLDFEPGIHYGQFQMQAGLTGINTVRIYNPTKNAHDHDPEAEFIKTFLPQLKELPPKLAIEPWLTTKIDEELYDFKYGFDYPKRIVDIKETRAFALKMLYGYRKNKEVKDEQQRILKTHTLRRHVK